MEEIKRRGLFLLCESGGEKAGLYRSILEMVSRFGFVSVEEVTYGFDLPLQKAKDRLKYLVKVGLLKRFESFTNPKTFFSLTSVGAQMVAAHAVSDEIVRFHPWQYNVLNQRHDRMLIRIYSSLEGIFHDNFKEWIGERTLRGNEDTSSRVLDGLFQLQIHKEFQGSNQTELWWCGLELELTLKSAARYRKQFRSLSNMVYDPFEKKQKIPLMLFLYGTESIGQSLRKYWMEQRDHYGRCLFIFGQVDRFLQEKGGAPLLRCSGLESREITAQEMNRIKVKSGVSLGERS